MHPTTLARWQIHFCVLLWGITAILGKLISLPALPLVWWRMLFVVLVLLLFPQVWKGLRTLGANNLLKYAGIGAIVALHWLTFYGAIKLSNASVGATCIAMAPAFIAFIEPWIARRAFSWRELFFGVAVLPGIALVVGGVPLGYRAGIIAGALSALGVAVFSSLNKRMSGRGDALTVTAIEMGAGVLTLSLLAPLMHWIFPPFDGPLLLVPSAHDLWLLLALSILCTLVPFALSLVALHRLSAYTVQLVINLEPVYAIIIAALFLGETHELTPKFYAGVAIVMAAVFLQPVFAHRKD